MSLRDYSDKSRFKSYPKIYARQKYCNSGWLHLRLSMPMILTDHPCKNRTAVCQAPGHIQTDVKSG